MARPSKNNAEYFSHDADMRNNRKVKALRRRFSHKGYAVWCFILETLTDADYFEIKFDEVTQDLLAADFDITNEELQSIVAYCVKIRLLQMKDDTLYCDALKQRFEVLVEKRKNDRERLAALRRKNKIVATTTNNDDNCRSDNSTKTSENDNCRSDNSTKTSENDNCRSDNSTKTSENDNCRSDNSTVKYSIGNNSKEESKGNINISLNNISSSLRSEDSSDKSDPEGEKFDFKFFLDFFNSELDSCGAIIPRLKVISKDRKGHILARVREHGAEVLTEMVRKAARSDFLNGKNSKGWIADFSWLIRPTNFVKVIEGNYDNKLNLNQQNGIFRQDGKDRRRSNEVEATSAEDYKTTF